MRCRAHYCARKYAPFTHANVPLAVLFCGYQTKLPTDRPHGTRTLIRFFGASVVFLFSAFSCCCCCWRSRCHRCDMVGWLRSLKYMSEIFLVCLWNVILNFSMAACSQLNHSHTTHTYTYIQYMQSKAHILAYISSKIICFLSILLHIRIKVV